MYKINYQELERIKKYPYIRICHPSEGKYNGVFVLLDNNIEITIYDFKDTIEVFLDTKTANVQYVLKKTKKMPHHLSLANIEDYIKSLFDIPYEVLHSSMLAVNTQKEKFDA